MSPSVMSFPLLYPKIISFNLPPCCRISLSYIVNTTNFINIMCTMVATCVIVGRLECRIYGGTLSNVNTHTTKTS